MAFFFYLALVGSALAGYANPPNIAPAMAAYGSYATPFNSFPMMNSYGMPPPAYSTAPIIPPFGITPAYAGAGAYNTGYPQAPMGGYGAPPMPMPYYGAGFRNSYQTGYNNYNTGYAGSPYATGIVGGGPVFPSGGPVLPSGGPVLPSGGPVLPSGGPVLPSGGPVFPTGGPITSSGIVSTLIGSPVNPAGVLPASFNNDPWANIQQPLLRGAPTKQVNSSAAPGTDEVSEESKKKARRV